MRLPGLSCVYKALSIRLEAPYGPFFSLVVQVRLYPIPFCVPVGVFAEEAVQKVSAIQALFSLMVQVRLDPILSVRVQRKPLRRLAAALQCHHRHQGSFLP